MTEEEKKSIADVLSRGNGKGERPRFLFLLAVLAVLLIIVLIIAIARRGSGSRNAALVTAQTLTAAVVSGEDRFAHHDDQGRLVGREPETAEALADALELTCELIEVKTVPEALSLLDTGAADVAFGRISRDQDLAGYVTSGEYGRCGLFLVTAIHDYTNTLDYMTGYTVGILDTVKQTATGLKGYEFITPVDYSDPEEMGKDVRDRAVSSGICTERDALALVRKYPGVLQTQEIAEGNAEAYVAVFPYRSGTYAAILDAVLTQ